MKVTVLLLLLSVAMIWWISDTLISRDANGLEAASDFSYDLPTADTPALAADARGPVHVQLVNQCVHTLRVEIERPAADRLGWRSAGWLRMKLESDTIASHLSPGRMTLLGITPLNLKTKLAIKRQCLRHVSNEQGRDQPFIESDYLH